jgi:hypothetical protein
MRGQSKWLVAIGKKKKKKELWEASLNSYATYRGKFKFKFKISLEFVQREKRPTCWPTKICSIWYHTEITFFFKELGNWERTMICLR